MNSLRSTPGDPSLGAHRYPYQISPDFVRRSRIESLPFPTLIPSPESHHQPLLPQTLSPSYNPFTMPVLEINTNTKVANKKEIAQKASKLMAQLLGKPESVFPFPIPIASPTFLPSLQSFYFCLCLLSYLSRLAYDS